MFKAKITIPHYGWETTFFEPTLDELLEMDAAQKSNPPDYAKLQEILANLLEGWNCTDRKDKPLPCNLEGVKQLPFSVLLKMVMALQTVVESGSSNPKDGSESSATSKL